MIGSVDYEKNMDFWQLDKWNGFFPVKWHVVKDVPNTLLRHIILENNDNRPVTYTRDTQEVIFLKMFSHSTCFFINEYCIEFYIFCLGWFKTRFGDA